MHYFPNQKQFTVVSPIHHHQITKMIVIATPYVPHVAVSRWIGRPFKWKGRPALSSWKQGDLSSYRNEATGSTPRPLKMTKAASQSRSDSSTHPPSIPRWHWTATWLQARRRMAILPISDVESNSIICHHHALTQIPHGFLFASC